jgi:hypothetical protein
MEKPEWIRAIDLNEEQVVANFSRMYSKETSLNKCFLCNRKYTKSGWYWNHRKSDKCKTKKLFTIIGDITPLPEKIDDVSKTLHYIHMKYYICSGSLRAELISNNSMSVKNTVFYRPADIGITYTCDDEGNVTSVCLYAIYNGNGPAFE